MKLNLMRQMLMVLVIASTSVIARADFESLSDRRTSTPSSEANSPAQQLIQDQPSNSLQGDWKTTCEADASTSIEEEVIVTGDIIARTFEISVGPACQATADVIGIQTGNFRVGREIRSGVFEIDWIINQANTTALTPAGAAELNAEGGLCGLKWQVGVAQDTTACLGPFVNLYSAFSVNESEFVWASRTASQTGLTADTRSTDLRFSTTYSRQSPGSQ